MNVAYLQFYPTLRCNMSCSFCFNRGLAGLDDANLEDFRKIVSVAREQGIGHIDFLGGEPTLHPHIVDMIAMVESAGLMTTMSSNGTNVDILERLSRRFPTSVLQIGISVNEAPISRRLDDYIKTYRPLIKTVYDPAVLDKDLFFGMDTEGLDSRLIYRDAVSDADLADCVSFDMFYSNFNRIKLQRPNLEEVYCSGFLPDERYPGLDEARCPAGTTKLAVLPDGSVYPCYLLFRYDHFRLGSLLEDDFQTIRDNPILDDFRHFEKNRCPQTACSLFSKCHGGCPATSYLFTGSLLGSDPRC
jgi:radical SAM protein with 4Fe4S-binding SPASM domain